MLSYSPNKPSLETPLPLIPPKKPGREEDSKTHSHHACRDERDTQFINGDQRQQTGGGGWEGEGGRGKEKDERGRRRRDIESREIKQRQQWGDEVWRKRVRSPAEIFICSGWIIDGVQKTCMKDRQTNGWKEGNRHKEQVRQCRYKSPVYFLWFALQRDLIYSFLYHSQQSWSRLAFFYNNLMLILN